jgi:hypothetical protein
MFVAMNLILPLKVSAACDIAFAINARFAMEQFCCVLQCISFFNNFCVWVIVLTLPAFSILAYITNTFLLRLVTNCADFISDTLSSIFL